MTIKETKLKFGDLIQVSEKAKKKYTTLYHDKYGKKGIFIRDYSLISNDDFYDRGNNIEILWEDSALSEIVKRDAIERFNPKTHKGGDKE